MLDELAKPLGKQVPRTAQDALELAEAGNARWLVTGDRDLLALQGQMRCEIVTAAEFVQEHVERSG